MTLVEVLAALAILGAILTAVLIARGRYTRQGAEAVLRLQAIEELDNLLLTWWSAGPTSIPRNASGILLDTQIELRWRTQRITVHSPRQLALEFIRVDVSRDNALPDKTSKPLLSVTLALPIEDVSR